ncbi:hypothetical protein BVRB_1g006700 [Beta vulgaris subsp. vulgaris]|nr:hypothetical protein BVRB_1g006700 [Beta vulgaris subsp. vulgaris]
MVVERKVLRVRILFVRSLIVLRDAEQACKEMSLILMLLKLMRPHI